MKAGPLSGAGLALVSLVLILYGSLWPFRFHALPPGALAPGAVLAVLLAPHGGGRGDILANLLLYLPLGAGCALGLRGRWPVALILALATLLGGLLSLAVEVAQLAIAGRVTSGRDVVLNTLGAGLGAALGLRLGGLAPRPGLPRGEAFAWALLGAWLATRLYPFVPALDWQAWKTALKPLLLAPAFEPLRLVRLAGLWLLAAELVSAISPWPLAVPAVLFGTLAAKVMIVGNSVSFTEAVAVLFALLGWAALAGRPAAQRAGVLLPLVLLAVLLDRLEPFQFGPARASFGWVPFRSVLGGSYGAGLVAGLTKFAMYGGLLWLLARRGVAPMRGAALVVGLALATSIAQVFLPGRSAEITDAVIALLAAGLLAFLRPSRSPY